MLSAFSRNSTKPSSYRLHKASGKAVVTINRRDRYLGVDGIPDSRLKDERLITAWMHGNEMLPRQPESSTGNTVAEVVPVPIRFAGCD